MTPQKIDVVWSVHCVYGHFELSHARFHEVLPKENFRLIEMNPPRIVRLGTCATTLDGRGGGNAVALSVWHGPGE